MTTDFWEENPEFKKLVEDLFGNTTPRGTPQFKLKPGQNMYRYFTVPGSEVWYCYTPHKCTEGWYYAFEFVPVGKGSRSGNATRFKVKNRVRFRKRKLAKARAIQRWEAAKEKAQA